MPSPAASEHVDPKAPAEDPLAGTSAAIPATRRVTRRRVAATIGVLLALAIAVAGGIVMRGRSPSPTVGEPLRVALSTTPHAALIAIAQANGYFKDEGLDVTLLPATHGKAAMEMMAKGSADLATAAEVPFVISVLRGDDVSAVATVVSTAQEMAVVARRDRGIATIGDLRGKRVAATPGTSGDYFLWALLVRHRLPPDAITWVPLPPNQIPAALDHGDVDAAATWEPVRGTALRQLGPNGVLMTEPNAYTVTHIVIGRNGFLGGHAGAMQKFVRALVRAERFAHDDPQAAERVTAAWLKLDPVALAGAWKGLLFRVDLRQSQLVTLEDEGAWAIERGYASPGAHPNFLTHLNQDALLAVAPERITIVR